MIVIMSLFCWSRRDIPYMGNTHGEESESQCIAFHHFSSVARAKGGKLVVGGLITMATHALRL